MNEGLDRLRFQPVEEPAEGRLRIIGLGEGAGRALNMMTAAGLPDADFIAADVDRRSLEASRAALRVHLVDLAGEDARPSGLRAAGRAEQILTDALEGASLAVLVVCLGGRAGAEAGPDVYRLIARLEIPCLAVVTLPYEFEGRSRGQSAERGLQALRDEGAACVVVPCDRLVETASLSASIKNAFELADAAVLEAVRTASGLVAPGCRFDRNRPFLENLGTAYLGMGSASGRHAVWESVQKAVFGPLLIDHPLDKARTVLVQISAGEDPSLHEIAKASQHLHGLASPKADIIIGTAVDPGLRKKTKAAVIVGNIASEEEGRRPERRAAPRPAGPPPMTKPNEDRNPWAPAEWERHPRYYETPIQRRLKTTFGPPGPSDRASPTPRPADRMRAGHPPGLPEEIPEERAGAAVRKP